MSASPSCFRARVNLFRTFADTNPEWVFASWSQLRSVMSVVLPTAVYVGALPYLGIYLTSMILIGGFMKWLGRYAWPITAAISIGVPLVAYFTFEKWFLVPLPKGPIEDWLGDFDDLDFDGSNNKRLQDGRRKASGTRRCLRILVVCFTASRLRCSRTTSR